MRTILLTFTVLLLAGVIYAETLNFDNTSAGSVPVGWSVAMTHKGGAPKWEVRADETGPSKPNVFAQVSNDRTGGRFPLAVYEKSSLKDGTLSVKFKAVSGSVDEAAGLVWRYRDPGNYYIVRANALENNVVLYKVVNGERISLPPTDSPSKTYGVKHPVAKQTWQTLAVAFEGDLFRVSFNGQKLFEVSDSTFLGPGKVGLWTKADSVTYFDDFQFDGK